MAQTDPAFEALEMKWEKLFGQSKWEELIDTTIEDKSLLSKQYKFDSLQIESLLGWLQMAINQNMEQKLKSSPKCSFCGKKPPAVRLGAGPAAFICNECVKVFSELL